MLRTLQRLLFPVLNALGPLLMILAVAQLLPLGIAYRDGEQVLQEFSTSGTYQFCDRIIFLFLYEALQKRA